MKVQKHILFDFLVTVTALTVAFGINLLLLELFDTHTMVPMIFVLGVFLVSWRTQGYFWGIAASGISILGIKNCKTLNMLPALLVPVLWFLLKRIVS